MFALRMMPLVAALVVWSLSAPAAEHPNGGSDNAYAAAKSAEIETMRARLGAYPSASAGATLMEADDLLRRFRQAPAAEKGGLRGQLDSTMARLELELSGAMRGGR